MPNFENKDRPVYYNVLEARAARIRSQLPLGEDAYVQGKGTLMDQEISRLHQEWNSYFYNSDRRLGVGSDVAIPSGTAVRTGVDFNDYVTTGEIRGKLKQETTTRFDRRTGKPYETTDSLFIVSVELPENPSSESFTNPKVVDIFVPNDKLNKIEDTT